MTAPTTLIWRLAGRPEPGGAKAKLFRDEPGICAVSGDQCGRTAPVAKVLGDNFTDRSLFRAPTSDRVGEAAFWVCSGKGTSSLRMWSIIAAPDHLLPPSDERAFVQQPHLWLGNRSDPLPIARLLEDPPEGEWLCSIALSGQKHVAPYAAVNRGPSQWTVRMENVNITSSPDEWQAVRAAANRLRGIGIGADNVLHGLPGLIKSRGNLDLWRRESRALAPYTGSPLLELALWTITKSTLERETHDHH